MQYITPAIDAPSDGCTHDFKYMVLTESPGVAGQAPEYLGWVFISETTQNKPKLTNSSNTDVLCM